LVRTLAPTRSGAIGDWLTFPGPTRLREPSTESVVLIVIFKQGVFELGFGFHSGYVLGRTVLSSWPATTSPSPTRAASARFAGVLFAHFGISVQKIIS